MTTTIRQGTESAANKTIGGIPHVHYLDFMSRGRGQVVRLFFEDAGIAYDDTRYPNAEYAKAKHDIIQKLNPTATVPVVELNGRILTQSYAILRHFVRILNAYDGKTEDEKYFVDLITDIVVDWRTIFVNAFFSDNKADYAKHKETDRAHFLKAVERHLKENPLAASGPFIIGDTFTYGDLVLYQILHDESLVQDGRKGLREYQRLTQFADAVEARPNIKAFLESDQYKG